MTNHTPFTMPESFDLEADARQHLKDLSETFAQDTHTDTQVFLAQALDEIDRLRASRTAIRSGVDEELLREAADMLNDKLIRFFHHAKAPPFHTCCFKDAVAGHSENCLVTRLRKRVRAATTDN